MRRCTVINALFVVAVLSGCTSASGPLPTNAGGPTSTEPRVTTTQVNVTRTATVLLVVPTSGPLEGLGTEAREGVELALRHAADDRKLPADLKIRIRTLDESARNISRSVDRAARGDDVIAIVGGVLETTEATLAPVARRREIALFSFTWASKNEPESSVRIGPSNESLIGEAARFVVVANPGAPEFAVVATPGSAGSVTLRDAIVAEVRIRTVNRLGETTIATSAPAAPDQLAQTPIVVTGAGDAAFDQYARIRLAPSIDPPSIVIPTDALGCRTAPAGLPNGTRCVSRGTWQGSASPSRTFREDAEASGLTPSWSTVVAYDTATLIARLAGPTFRDPNAKPSATRTRLLSTKSSTEYNNFSGVNGRLIPTQGFRNNAQVLRAEDGRWVGESENAN